MKSAPAVTISKLKRKQCNQMITFARKRLDEYNQPRRAPYQRLIAALPTEYDSYGTLLNDNITGLLCYHCRKLITLNSKCVSKSGGSCCSKMYHEKCARRLNII